MSWFSIQTHKKPTVVDSKADEEPDEPESEYCVVKRKTLAKMRLQYQCKYLEADMYEEGIKKLHKRVGELEILLEQNNIQIPQKS